MRRDPDKLRAWQERSARTAQENRRKKQRGNAPASRSTPMRRTEIKRTPIKRVSASRSREQRARVSMLKDKYGTAPVVCERCGQEEAVDAHEIVPRSQGGSITDPANVRALGRKCHDWIHAHPKEARATGWLLRSTDLPT